MITAAIVTVVLVIAAFYAGVCYWGIANANKISELEQHKASSLTGQEITYILHAALLSPRHKNSDVWNAAILDVEQQINEALK